MKLILFLLFTFSLGPALGFTVLIDPGHGGDDKGAVARYYYGKKKWRRVMEKDIALSLSIKIHEKLQKRGINAYLTRSIDRNVELYKRAEMAEKLKADLFISVHINASPAKKPRGFETYYLDNHKDSAIKKIEETENKNLKGEELVVNQILTDLVIQRTVHTSKALAGNIHREIQKLVGKRYKLRDRGIKPGLFYVLALAKRPAILLEVGFLSNSKELKKLLNKGFQDRYATAVAKGIDLYLNKDKKSAPSLL